jgi:hypothetical protein
MDRHIEATEFAFRCKLCDHSEAWTTNQSSRAAGLWHLFKKHTEFWVEHTAAGQIPPPNPGLFGQRFEEWERQS